MKGFTTVGTEDTEYTNEITRRIIGAAMRVHTALGSGLLESAYEVCLAYEFQQEGLDSSVSSVVK
jgi:GxxExxY protein